MIGKFLGICALFLFGVFSIAYAATSNDQFIVSQQVGGDTTPPSTPTNLSATPIAQTQIDLSWTASTDDLLLSGYQVFRDLVQIATTTLTSYSDTGLTASTTYSYHIVAFDSFYNYSSSSASVATTTFGITPTSTPTTTPQESGGANTELKLQQFEIVPDIYSALLKWKTSRFAQFELRWGRTSSYELGFVSNEIYKREHSTVITDLEAGTTYEYELIGYDKDNSWFVLSRGQFKTLDIPDTQAPSNVRNLTATAKGNDVELSWENPSEEDFSRVRIIRSHLFYPLDPYDGFITYQGSGSSYTDKNVLRDRTVQYYTVFSYDENGNISSGATVAVSKGGAPSYEMVESDDFKLSFEDIEFLQEGSTVDSYTLRNTLPTTVRIAYEKLPEHLKTIIVTMTHPDDESLSFSFLLRIDHDKTFYEATLAPLEDLGEYPVTLTVFDYQTRLMKEVKGSVQVVGEVIAPEVFPVLFVSEEFNMVFWLILVLALLLLLLLLLKGVRSETPLGAAASVGGAFVLLLSLLGFSVMYFENETASSGPALLADAGFVSVFTPVWVLLFGAACVMITLILRTRK